MPRQVFCIVCLFVLSVVSASAISAQDKIDPNKFAITDPNAVDTDYHYQGEYYGSLINSRNCGETTGLQVIARGDGKFDAVLYQGGLPGNGWNGEAKSNLSGSITGTRLVLVNDANTISIKNKKAFVANSSNRNLGTLTHVKRISRTMGTRPSAGATVLFNGTSVEHFVDGKITEDGLLQMGTITAEPVRDFQLHLEFRLPYMPYATGQHRANSGVYIQERYEVQILDSFGLEGAFNEAGSLYRTKTPDINMCFPPLYWQTYDIYFTAAKFDDASKKITNARITVYHNGITVQDDFEIPNKTGAGHQEGPAPGLIKLQDHSNPVVFRNIWIVNGNGKQASSKYTRR
ncbi:MAG: 3-keto-disaccharide hydrolase [Pirellulales bacterium]